MYDTLFLGSCESQLTTDTRTRSSRPCRAVRRMAKTGVWDSDPTVMAKATELKKELQRLVRMIVDDDEFSIDSFDHAERTLLALKELEINRKSSGLKGSSLCSFKDFDNVNVLCPEEFRCPISKELMKDPVIVSTGQTYDRSSIQKWLKEGNRTCPQTQQVLSHVNLTPNILIKEMISKWCKNWGIDLASHVQCVDEDRVMKADRDKFFALMEKLSSTISEQKEAVKELRLLTKRMPAFRALFGESDDALFKLLKPLCDSELPSGVQFDLQEDIVTILLNVSIHDSNKKLVGENPSVIPLLMDALSQGTIESRSNAAAALFTLSALDSNKTLIGQHGALKPLVDLLEEGHPSAMTDAASAIFNLCIIHENRGRAVRSGAVKVILDKIKERILVDELLSILAMLSSHHKAIEEMGELGAVPCLLKLMRETQCARNKENCIAVLYSICYSDRTKLKEMKEEEKTHKTISDLARNGTSRAKRKASGILERLNRAVNYTHTA